MKEPGLPNLTDRTRCPKPGNISAWVIWDMKRLGALEPGFKDEFEGQDCLGNAKFKIETFPDLLLIRIGSNIQCLSIVYSSCGKGGRRPWWQCPACAARRGVLFLRARNWGCRGCLALPFRSQRMTRRDRAIAKAKRLHLLLGGSGSLVDELPLERPHRMRRRTYLSKRKQFAKTLAIVNQLIHQSMKRFLGPDGRLDRYS
jgi:hypothetical protein